MNISNFPNKVQCKCEDHSNRVAIFIKSLAIVTLCLASVVAVLWGGWALISHLFDKFGLWKVVGIIAFTGFSLLCGTMMAHDTINEQERQKRECKTHNV